MAKLLVTDDLWAVIEPLLPTHVASPKGGQPRTPDRVCLTGIMFVLRTGIPWEHFPQEMGCCGMTLWNRLHEWSRAGVWTRLHRCLLKKLDQAGLIDWSRAVVDSASVRAVGGAKKPGPTPRIAASRDRSITPSRTATACPSRSPSRAQTVTT